MRKIENILSQALFTCVVVVFACGCQEHAKTDAEVTEDKGATLSKDLKNDSLPRVAVIEAQQVAIQPGFEVPAIIEAIQTASVHPEVNALIKKMHITPGAFVKKGDLLVELEESEYRANLDEAKAGLQAAMATVQQAEDNFKRAEKLRPEGYISGQDYDRLEANLANSRAAVAQAEAKLERAELDMKRTKIFAQFDGKISAAFHAVGDRVGPMSAKPLFELVEVNPIYAVAEVEQRRYEDFVLKRMQLQEQGMDMPELEVSLKLPSGKEYPLRGKFENWDYSAAANRSTITGRVVFDNPDSLLLPGQNVTVFGRLNDSIDRILIPQKAVSQDQEGHYVFVVDDDGKVQRANIEVGIREGDQWAVASGLNEGAQVVVEGLQKVRPGILVDTKAYRDDTAPSATHVSDSQHGLE